MKELVIMGDCLIEMQKMEDNSMDSIVSDPPYGISFMGKKWDYDVPKVEIWQEALRVLKPGGYALIACGTRTQHRMAVNIEDAGFEIRDIVAYLYGSGFPKSLNVFKQLQKNCTCGNMEAYEKETIYPQQEAKPYLRPMQETDLPQTLSNKKTEGKVLQSELSEQSPYIERTKTLAVLSVSSGKEKSSVERGNNLQETKGELQRSDISEMPEGVSTNGKEGRIYNATQAGNGSTTETNLDKNGGGASRRPQSEQQQNREPCAFCKQWGTQKIRGTEGWGTALKPAMELWTLCRKPLSEKTVALNVLKWGTGGINIDGCRVGTTTEIHSNGKRSMYGGNSLLESKTHNETTEVRDYGRFPANLIHDGSDEVVGMFPSSKSTLDKTEIKRGTSKSWFTGDHVDRVQRGDEGSAARFFYCAKASKSERNFGLEGMGEKENMRVNAPRDNELEKHSNKMANHHPTVKPIALMRYLCRLITPKGGTILDPFAGSGTTGVAAKKLNRNFILIEKEPEYIEIIKKRLAQESLF